MLARRRCRSWRAVCAHREASPLGFALPRQYVPRMMIKDHCPSPGPRARVGRKRPRRHGSSRKACSCVGCTLNSMRCSGVAFGFVGGAPPPDFRAGARAISAVRGADRLPCGRCSPDPPCRRPDCGGAQGSGPLRVRPNPARLKWRALQSTCVTMVRNESAESTARPCRPAQHVRP